MVPPRLSRFVASLALPALLFTLVSDAGAEVNSDGPAFEVTYAPEVAEGPISVRVYVMLGPVGASREPRFGPNWFNPEPFFAVEATDWKPGEPLRVGPEATGFPTSLDALEPGTYAAQAVVRLNPDTHHLGNGEGNAYGPVVEVEIGPESHGPFALAVDQVVPARPFAETDRIKLVEIPSPLLSAFHGRPIRQRAAVILPEAAIDGEGDDSERFPTLYNIPGFGGDHTSAPRIVGGQTPYARLGVDFVRVLLDPDCGTGHHVFADSANNGPRGQAFVEELIPYIEANFPAIANPKARLLTGHSSGGWSTLWLQVNYPETFGGVWATAPDSVDFRDFQRIDLYAPDANMFRDPEGNRRPIARRGTEPILWYDDFSRMEDVIGPGGQLHSFEAVFSPKGPDGEPLPLWDRATGDVFPEVAATWKAYDIRLILEENWDELAPKLAGKIHAYMGDLDTFYLEGATALLKESLERLGSDAAVELFPGKDHSSLMTSELIERMDREMHEAVAEFLPEPVTAAEAGR